MPTQVRARYTNGKLEPLEPLDLKDGCEVSVTVTEEPEAETETLAEMFQRLRESVPDDAWAGLPTDLVRNKKHYLYGHPKEED